MPTCWDCGRDDHGGPRCGRAWSPQPQPVSNTTSTSTSTSVSSSPAPPQPSHSPSSSPSLSVISTCWDCGRVHYGARCGGPWNPTRQPPPSPSPLPSPTSLHSAPRFLSSLASSDEQYARSLQARLLQEDRDAQLAQELQRQLDEANPAQPPPTPAPAPAPAPASAPAPAAAECIICCDAARECLLLPCRHLSTCSTCAQQLVHCPVCRADIQQRIAVFM